MSSYNIQKINELFSVMLYKLGILSELGYLPNGSNLRAIFLDYQKNLIEEEKFLDKNYHLILGYFAHGHPLRCAQALQKCLEEYEKKTKKQAHCFKEKLADFQALATNSKCYPNAQIAGLIVAGALTTFSLALLIGFILSVPYTVPAALFVAAAIAVVCFFPVYSMLIGKFAGAHFEPIYEAEEKGLRFFESLSYSTGSVGGLHDYFDLDLKIS